VDLSCDIAARFFTTRWGQQHTNADTHSDPQQHPADITERVTLTASNPVADRTHSIPGRLVGILRALAQILNSVGESIAQRIEKEKART